MLSRKRFLLILLAMIAAFACLMQQQRATKARFQKRLAELQQQRQQQLSAQEMMQEEHRLRRWPMFEELDCIKHLQREERNDGDHWLPGELDRLFKRPLPSDEA